MSKYDFYDENLLQFSVKNCYEKKGILWVYAMKRVAVGAHFLTPWVFEPVKRLDDRADYCLGCSSLP